MGDDGGMEGGETMKKETRRDGVRVGEESGERRRCPTGTMEAGREQEGGTRVVTWKRRNAQ